MKFCTKCGSQNNMNAFFCFTCGNSLAANNPNVANPTSYEKYKYIYIGLIILVLTGLGILLFNMSRVDPHKISTNTDGSSQSQTSKPILTPVVESNEEYEGNENDVPIQTLQDISSSENSPINKATLTQITTKMNDFFDKDNAENVQGILEHFEYPVMRYYGDYNLSYSELNDIFQRNIVNKLAYHKLTPYFSTSTVSFNGSVYEITLKANFAWETLKYPGLRKSKNISLKYILNSNLKMTSAYEL